MNESVFLWIAILWMAAAGGSVGSFLNVVVYRLPAGLSLSYPSSHCPKCQHPIRWHDNVPMLGWILLQGRCRDCRCWIPMRYPAVEATVMALFVLTVLVEGASLGGNLPPRPVAVVDGIIYPDLSLGQLAGIISWHLLLLCTLLPASLIRYDGHEVPPRLFAPGFAMAAFASFLWPHLYPQPAMVLPAGPTPAPVDLLTGLIVGAMIGSVAWRLLEPSHRPDLAWSGALVGAMLGWQAAVAVSGATLVLAAASKILGRVRRLWSRVPPVAWLGLCSTIWIFQWRHLAESLFGAVAE